MGFLLAFLFVTKTVTAPFWSFQRYDVINYSSAAGFAVNLVVLAAGLSLDRTNDAQILAAIRALEDHFALCERDNLIRIAMNHEHRHMHLLNLLVSVKPVSHKWTNNRKNGPRHAAS